MRRARNENLRQTIGNKSRADDTQHEHKHDANKVLLRLLADRFHTLALPLGAESRLLSIERIPRARAHTDIVSVYALGGDESIRRFSDVIRQMSARRWFLIAAIAQPNRQSITFLLEIQLQRISTAQSEINE